MLKTTGSPDEPAPSKNNGSKSASNRNNNSRPVFKRNNGNNKINEFGIGDGVKYAKKSRKSKGQKLSKSGKLKSEKKRLSFEIWLSQEKVVKKWEFT